MPADIDALPAGVNVHYRAGNSFTLTLTWPAGSLSGRSFTATLDAAALTVGVVADVMTVTVSAAQTTAAGSGGAFTLNETTTGTPQVIMIGTWRASASAAVSVGLTVTVNESAGQVAVTAAGATPTRSTVRRWTQSVAGLGAVCFVWDDGFATSKDVAKINEARGQQVTFAITTDLVGSSGSYLTAAEVRALEAGGHEIAAHGLQHTTGLPSLTAFQRALEYAGCLAWFGSNGISTPTTWVYTFGGAAGRSDDTDRELWGRVDRVLDTIGSFTPDAAIRRDQFGFVMKRQQAESDTTGAFQRAKTLIRLAAAQPVVVAFYMHQLNAGANSLTTAEYEELCDLCVSLGVSVVTARDALPANQMLIDPGFEDADTIGLWEIQTTGTSTATAETDTPVTGLPGTKSLKLHAVDTGAFEFAMALQYVPIEPNRVYTLSGRYRTAAGAGTAGKVRFGSYDHKGTIIGSATTANLAEATSWTRFTQDFTAAATGVIAQVALLNDPAASQTTDVWFDHVCLLPKSCGEFG